MQHCKSRFGSIPIRFLQIWWASLTNPELAAGKIAGGSFPQGFTRFLAAWITLLYAFYGSSMGFFLGTFPALVSSMKMPMLYGLTLAVCFPCLYTLNCLAGPKLTARQTLQLLLFALSANAVALASYVPFSYFFTLSSSVDAYHSLVLMHVVVFAISGLLTLVVVTLLFRATARAKGRPLRWKFLLAWGILYAFVGTQMAWSLRPWIGSREAEYQVIRPIEGSFYEAVWMLIKSAIQEWARV